MSWIMVKFMNIKFLAISSFLNTVSVLFNSSLHLCVYLFSMLIINGTFISSAEIGVMGKNLLDAANGGGLDIPTSGILM